MICPRCGLETGAGEHADEATCIKALRGALEWKDRKMAHIARALDTARLEIASAHKGLDRLSTFHSAAERRTSLGERMERLGQRIGPRFRRG